MAVKALQDRLEERRSKEIQKLNSLLQINKTVSGTLNLKAALMEDAHTLGRTTTCEPRWSCSTTGDRELAVEAG